jgi:hypothetical protein
MCPGREGELRRSNREESLPPLEREGRSSLILNRSSRTATIASSTRTTSPSSSLQLDPDFQISEVNDTLKGVTQSSILNFTPEYWSLSK